MQEKLKQLLGQSTIDEIERTRSSSGSSKTSSSNGSLNPKSGPLDPSQIEAFKKSFDLMDPQKKWEISKGVFVEDKMYAFGLKCAYEHPVHSFIFDVDDPCWTTLFSADEMAMIKNSGNSSMPPLSKELKDFFQRFTELNNLVDLLDDDPVSPSHEIDQESFLKKLWSIATEYGFHDPSTHFDEDWAQRSILEYISAYRWNVIQRLAARGSEMDFVVRIWSQLDKCFDNIHIETIRNRGCIATSVRVNGNRRVTGIESLVPKSFSTKPDLILYREDIEYGCSEVGKNDDGGVGEKEIVESALKCPKTMKDMLLRAASKIGNATNKTRQLQIVGFHQTSLRMHLSVLDCPNGYVCRLRRSTEYTMPLQPSLIPSQLIPILKLTCKAKEIVRRTIRVLETPIDTKDDPDLSCNSSLSDTIVLPFALCKSVNRKRNRLT
ncbi:hypothetical protein CLU79DRAFT_102917 [Phycomyces nitens]|nr:hypothetical protein CLU79DRAFT_102917 [Phycomyces nitens]